MLDRACRFVTWLCFSTGCIHPVQSVHLEPQASSSSSAGRAVVYVHGDGGHLTAGPADDSARWVSAAIYNSGYGAADIPAFEGTSEEWAGMMRCTREYFAGLPIEITDRTPAGSHQMVIVGGTAAHAGTVGRWGQATSVEGQYADRGIGFVFSADHNVGRRVTNLCQSLAHEIGHLLGAQHTQDCRDLMSNDRSCEHLGFIASTREQLATTLARWGEAAARVQPELITGIAGEPSTETGLLFASGAVVTSGQSLALWPIAVTAPQPLARALLRIVTPEGGLAEYTCLSGDAICQIRGNQVEGGFPYVFGEGEYHLLVEVTYVSGQVRRSEWTSMTP